MPIPAAPREDTTAEAIVALFRQMHDQLRDELSPLSDDDVNWSPAPGANSIATVITHLVGSETETVRIAAGLECRRDRDAEFAATRTPLADVLGLLAAADALLDLAAPTLEARLWEPVTLPTLPADEVRPVITWLVGNYGHAREHVGHVQLTRHFRQPAVP